MRLRQQLRFLIWVAVMGVALTACIVPNDRRVGLRSVAADLVFGIPPPLQPAAPADILPVDEPVNVNEPVKQIAPPPKLATCDTATVNEVEVEASDQVSNRPTAGRYRWKQSGFTFLPNLGRFNLSQLTARSIKDVAPLSGGARDFRYTQVQQEEFGGDTVETTFEVIQSRPDPRGGAPNVVREEAVPNGIFLTQIRRVSGGRTVSTFNANPPIVYLPLPVVVGFQRTTDSADPTSFQVLSHTTNVRTRTRYDACGELVDAWLVDGEQTFTSPSGQVTRDYNYAIATQLGGLLVFEHVESPCDSYDEKAASCKPEGRIKYDTNIGQLSPRET